MSKKKSRSNLNVVTVDTVARFLRDFHVGDIVSVQDFDEWCIKEGLIVDPGTMDKKSAAWALLLKQRNNARMALNRVATSDSVDGWSRYSLDNVPSVDGYKVYPIAESYVEKRDKLPAKVSNFVLGQKSRLNRLLSGTDLDQLAIGTKLKVEGLVEQEQLFVEDIGYATDRAAKVFSSTIAAVEAEIKRQEESAVKLLNKG